MDSENRIPPKLLSIFLLILVVVLLVTPFSRTQPSLFSRFLAQVQPTVPAGSSPTIAELQAKIAVLLSQIEALKAQLKNIPPGFQFTRDLTEGSSGIDVKYLQMFLNKRGNIINSSGPGSPGNEVTYFGYSTRKALSSYQVSENISPAVGYFGPLTRERVNKELLTLPFEQQILPTPPTTPPTKPLPPGMPLQPSNLSFVSRWYTTAETARLGHPINFELEPGVDDVEINVTVSGGTLPVIIPVAVSGKRASFTPLQSGTHTFTISGNVNGIPGQEILVIQVDSHNINSFVPLREKSTRPAMPIWHPESVGLSLDNLADYHMCRMVRIDRPGEGVFGRDAVTLLPYQRVYEELHQAYINGEDICLLFFKFPHPWQFNPSDYNGNREGEYNSEEGFWNEEWESPFAIQGPAQVGRWTGLVLDTIQQKMTQEYGDSNFSIDTVILDWEGREGARHNNPSCQYQYSIFSRAFTEGICEDRTPIEVRSAIQNDMRFRNRALAVGLDPDNSRAWTINATDDERWKLMHEIFYNEKDRVLKTIFYKPVKDRYPGALFTQYGFKLFRRGAGLRTSDGQLRIPNKRPDATNSISPTFYFNQEDGLGEISKSKSIEESRIYYQEMKLLAPNNKYVPWIPDSRKGAEESGFSPQTQWEIFMHMLLGGADSLQLFNPESNGDNDSAVAQNAWASFLNLVPSSRLEVLTSHNDGTINRDYILTAAQNNGMKYIFISFLRPDVTSVTYKSMQFKRPDGLSFGFYIIP